MYRMQDLIKLGRDVQGQQLKRAQLGLQGKINPWDLPEWRPIIEGIRGQTDKGLASLSDSLKSNEVTGPAAGLTLERATEGGQDKVLDLANQMRQEQTAGANNASAMGQDINKLVAGFVNQRKQMEDARDAAKMSMMTQAFTGGLAGIAGGLGAKGGGKGGGGGCCFMFIMGEGEVIDQVQRFKYETFGYDSHIANGYRWMSLKLMPLIRKNKYVKKLIKFFITQPLSKFAIYKYSHNPKVILYIPAGLFWCTTWEMIGRIVAYNSEPYQNLVKELGI